MSFFRQLVKLYPTTKLNQLRNNISLCVEHDTNSFEIIRLLGETIRKVARSNPTVSHNLLAIVVPKASARNDEVILATSPEPRVTPPIPSAMFFDIPAGTDHLTKLGPSIVMGNVLVEETRFVQHSPIISLYEQQILSGTTPSELNEASLIAYANVSPLADEWADYVRTLGFAIMEGPTSGFGTIQLLKSLGIKSLSDIDVVLRDARTWGKNFLMDSLVNSRTGELSSQGAEPTQYVERIEVINLLIRKSRGSL